MAKPPTSPATDPGDFAVALGDTATTGEVARATQASALERELARVRAAYPDPFERFYAGLAVLRAHEPSRVTLRCE